MDPPPGAPQPSSAVEAGGAPAPPIPGAASTPFPPPSATQQAAPPSHDAQQPHPHPSQPQLPSPSPVSPGLPPNASVLAQPPLSGNALLPPFAVAGDGSAPASSTASSSSTAVPSVTRPAPPNIVSYDPNAASDADEDDEEEGGSPKKKRKGASGKRSESGNGSASGSAAGAAGGDPEKGRRKIEIEYITKKEKRHITFSKRKAGIMKKAYELATLTGTEVLLLVVSETGIVYTFTTTKFQPLVGAAPNGQPSEGQRLIQQCLAVSPDEEKNSDYISPPPDGPLLPLPPSAQKRPFEANSSIHGGQIALRTKQIRPRNKRPAPIVPPAPGPSGSASLPTPGIHAQMDQMQNMPMSPHALHPLNPAPGGDHYPPSPGYAPHHPGMNRPSVLPSPIHASHEYQDMMDRSQNDGAYGPGGAYPPPPALGYTHQLPNPPLSAGRAPHPLDPYPHPGNDHSPNASPRQARHPGPHPSYAQYQAAAPRSMGGGDAYAPRASYGAPGPGEDTHMLSPYQAHAQPPGPGGPASQLPNPPPEMWAQHHLPQPPQGYQADPRAQHGQPMYLDGGEQGMRR
ncbi:hypothetical protein JCM10207_003816 [Rhodosporidiobolus poonsookiae]